MFSQISSENQKIRKTAKMRFFCSELAVTEPWLSSDPVSTGSDGRFWSEHVHGTFVKAIYNCVSRGQRATIEQFQLKTCQLIGGARAARYRTQKLETDITSAADELQRPCRSLLGFRVWPIHFRSICTAKWQRINYSISLSWLAARTRNPVRVSTKCRGPWNASIPTKVLPMMKQ